ncbi:hypothetical protein [Methylophaga thiooxydans]|nr:hypothetical protein [Methylophaga thiooxydans]
MDYTDEWKSIKRKVTIIGVIEIVLLVLAFALSLQVAEPMGSYLTQAIVPVAVLLHAFVLFKLWRCPNCGKRLKFWQRHHNESVSSLSGCIGCGAKFK